MRREIADILVCPRCGVALVLDTADGGDDVAAGKLRCRCGGAYPVESGIPRFVETKATRTAQSFGLEWRTFLVARRREDEAVFRAKTGLRPEDLRGKLVLDAGCGGGRYARVAARWGARVFAVDLSRAVDSARDLCKGLPDVHVIQADLGRLPFREGLFDVIYSIGVLHHTPDTRRYLHRVVRHLAPGGSLSLWLYSKWRPALEAVNSLERALATRLPLPVLLRLAEVVEPIGRLKLALARSSSPLLRRLGVFLNVLAIGVSMHPARTQRICDTFDWYAPEHQWHHTDEEVRGWLIDEGFDEIENLSEDPDYFFHPGQGRGVNFKARLARR